MWIVRIALDRPYTFVVMALAIMLMTPVTLLRTPVDIFPRIDIPVIGVVYNYGGLYLDKGVAVFNSKPAVDAIRYYGKMLGNYGPKGVTSMSWENIMPLFQAGKVAIVWNHSVEAVLGEGSCHVLTIRPIGGAVIAG